MQCEGIVWAGPADACGELFLFCSRLTKFLDMSIN